MRRRRFAALLPLLGLAGGCEPHPFEQDLEFLVEYGTYANYCYLAIHTHRGEMGLLSPECIHFDDHRDRYESIMDSVYDPVLWEDVDEERMRELRRANESVNRLLRRIAVFDALDTSTR